MKLKSHARLNNIVKDRICWARGWPGWGSKGPWKTGNVLMSEFCLQCWAHFVKPEKRRNVDAFFFSSVDSV